ncbi:hypothetical protein L207DRAFT_324166 [Hyaloscypha variabilis F]|uniref:Uncharacterized protein n=1 Tax=Hyaloscypha variabilis (strain UAMH 11265 / GT02V1 / F) TaxID=1149755 RepID=A0A2J6RSC1_HYAVF|nr:hypothetical protein L207DRAFT_324166 [Hyaloscypha variabilis F]
MDHLRSVCLPPNLERSSSGVSRRTLRTRLGSCFETHSCSQPIVSFSFSLSPLDFLHKDVSTSQILYSRDRHFHLNPASIQPGLSPKHPDNLPIPSQLISQPHHTAALQDFKRRAALRILTTVPSCIGQTFHAREQKRRHEPSTPHSTYLISTCSLQT